MDQQQTPRFVRINKLDHPMRGMIGTVTQVTEDGFEQITLLNTSFSGYFKPEDLQEIRVGTRVIVEHTILDFYKNSMMIAGGWTPLARIIDIVE
jgi:AMMECR1 domain-containing protein